MPIPDHTNSHRTDLDPGQRSIFVWALEKHCCKFKAAIMDAYNHKDLETATSEFFRGIGVAFGPYLHGCISKERLKKRNTPSDEVDLTVGHWSYAKNKVPAGANDPYYCPSTGEWVKDRKYCREE